jgi:hypothetical protein
MIVMDKEELEELNQQARELQERMNTPGCRCRLLENTSLDMIQVAGEDDCPWHGFGQGGVLDFASGKREFSITAGRQEILPRMRNGLFFGVEQRVLLRWKDGDKWKHLMWLPYYRYQNNGIETRDQAHMELEERPNPNSLYIPKRLEFSGKINRAGWMYYAKYLAKETGLPREVFDSLARIYKPGWTYYLTEA